jgi:hypothetical protein
MKRTHKPCVSNFDLLRTMNEQKQEQDAPKAERLDTAGVMILIILSVIMSFVAGWACGVNHLFQK